MPGGHRCMVLFGTSFIGWVFYENRDESTVSIFMCPISNEV